MVPSYRLPLARESRAYKPPEGQSKRLATAGRCSPSASVTSTWLWIPIRSLPRRVSTWSGDSFPSSAEIASSPVLEHNASSPSFRPGSMQTPVMWYSRRSGWDKADS
jgi:hypothetical protein